MSTFASLSIGTSALYAAQRAVETAANNVANANTAGYTRQRVSAQPAVPIPGTPGLRGDGMRSTGVTVIGVNRLRDHLADVAYRSEAGTDGAASARAETLSRAETVLGPYAFGSPEQLSVFQAAWDQLSLSPAEPSLRGSVLAAGTALADGLRGSAEQLDAVAAGVQLRAADQVTQLNGLLANVAQLNQTIREAVVGGQSPNDLLDQRDSALDQIAALTGARVTDGTGTDVNVTLGGTALVSGYTAVPVRLTAALGLVTGTGIPLAPQGQLGGYLGSAVADLGSYRLQLDAVATTLRDTMNGLQAGGKGLDGNPGPAFFVGTAAGNLTINPALAISGVAASATGAAHDGDNAITVARELRTARVFPDGSTLPDGLRAFNSRVGQAASDAARAASTAHLSVTAALTARASADGVNVDEEMVDLVKFQHQYSAASRVITVVDDMLDRIINRMGA